MNPVRSGLDLFFKERKRFRDVRVGLLCHQATVNAQLQHVISLFRDAKIPLQTIFGPEHGLWGTAQDQVPVESGDIARGSKAASGPPVISLYGDNRAPKADQLSDIDVMVCDLQDVGSRYYTFVWTMALAMQVCAMNKKKFIVLDRPNPINGTDIEGPGLDLNYASFVGLYPLPVRHGMTAGEIALWVNETFDVGADLEIIRMEGWKRSMYFDETGLPWVLPSPNMPTLETAIVYPGGCLLEGTELSEGRGTTRPFELFGAPYLEPERIVAEMAKEKLPGVTFRGCYIEPTFHKFKEQTCGAIQVHVTDRDRFQSFLTYAVLIQTIYQLYPNDFKWRNPPYEYETEKWPFDILCGDDAIRKTIEQGRSVRPLERSWKETGRQWAKERKEFLLYR